MRGNVHVVLLGTRAIALEILGVGIESWRPDDGRGV